MKETFISKNEFLQRPQIEALCAYRDVSGIFTKNLVGEAEVVAPQEDKNLEEPTVIGNVDNEDDLLYGDAPTFQMPIFQPPKAQDVTAKKQPWYEPKKLTITTI